MMNRGEGIGKKPIFQYIISSYHLYHLPTFNKVNSRRIRNLLKMIK